MTITELNQPQPPYQHGQQHNGYVYDANLNQWLLVNKSETVAGKAKAPSPKVLAIAGVVTVASILGLIGVANIVADSKSSSPSSSEYMSKDDLFVQALADEADILPVTTDAFLVESATSICKDLKLGVSPTTVASKLYALNDVSRPQSTQWVTVAARFYCPSYA